MPSSKRSTGAAGGSGRQNAVCSPAWAGGCAACRGSAAAAGALNPESDPAPTARPPQPPPGRRPSRPRWTAGRRPRARWPRSAAGSPRCRARCPPRGRTRPRAAPGRARTPDRRTGWSPSENPVARRAALDRPAGDRHAVHGRLPLARPQRHPGPGSAGRVGQDQGEGGAGVGQRGDLGGDGGEHPVGAGPGDPQAGVQRGDAGPVRRGRPPTAVHRHGARRRCLRGAPHSGRA